jgi:hypothetical protein
MDNSKHLKDSAHLLEDLESIRQLLGDESMQPPLLTDALNAEGQIPLLFDVVSGQVVPAEEPDAIPTLTAEPDATPQAAAPQAEPEAATPGPNPDDLLHLDSELRAAAQLIMQDVIDDFAPHIENEIKRRLDARMERLLSQYNT